MTIKQAAMWLCQPGIVSMIHDPTTKEALSVAVKALAEPELSTNLAEVGTDCISRQAAIDALYSVDEYNSRSVKAIKQLPPIQPEIVRCKDCKYMTEHYDIDGNVPYWTCSEWDSGTDYDGFCHYAEKREVTT